MSNVRVYMKGWIRLGLVLSAFWVAGVVFFTAWQFFSIPSSNCIFIIDPYQSSQAGEKYMNISAPLKTSLFSCNVYSQFISNSWQRYFISVGGQIIEFDIKHFLFLLFIPLAFSWAVMVSLVKSMRWVKNGFKS